MKTILISAGHSTVPPLDPGAVGPKGEKEANIALKMRDQVAAKLRAKGLDVTEDGADGVNEPLSKALTLARGAQVAIEFHLNAGPPTATGIEVLSKPNRRALGRALAQAIHAATGSPLRGGDGGWKADNSGAHHRLAFCEAGGLIVELAFISSTSDLDALINNFGTVAENIANVVAGEVGQVSAAVDTQTSYTVTPGDNLTKIAARFGMKVEELKQINGLDSDRIDVGQLLKLK